LGRRLHPAEHLPYRELLVEEESLHERRRDRDRARRDAGRLAVAYQMDFATLGYGFLGRCRGSAGRGMSKDGFNIDAV
jgi:hypothetical protein